MGWSMTEFVGGGEGGLGGNLEVEVLHPLGGKGSKGLSWVGWRGVGVGRRGVGLGRRG